MGLMRNAKRLKRPPLRAGRVTFVIDCDNDTQVTVQIAVGSLICIGEIVTLLETTIAEQIGKLRGGPPHGTWNLRYMQNVSLHDRDCTWKRALGITQHAKTYTVPITLKCYAIQLHDIDSTEGSPTRPPPPLFPMPCGTF